MVNEIFTIDEKKEEKFLRTKTVAFDFRLSAKETDELIRRMKKIMQRANGIGLSANQIGLPWRIFVAQVPDTEGDAKFYAVFDPKIEKTQSEDIGFEEGCLSVPGVYGEVKRPERIVITGFDKRKKPLRIKAWGLLARVFQHEIDHLDGTLFIDKSNNLHEAPISDRLRKREEKMTES